MESRKLKVAIIGATGYTGGELVRLLLSTLMQKLLPCSVCLRKMHFRSIRLTRT